ncbi:MAG: alpha-amylase family glycosyl hydrolase, partial [bacterium]
NSDAYIVGECWAGKSVYAQYYASGIDSLFDFAFAAGDGAIAKFINGGYTADVVVDTLAAEAEQFGGYGEGYIDAPFFTNHDTARGAGFFANDDGSKVKMAQAMNLLTTGNAFLYYGEEIGMRGSGKDENKRAPMYWSDEKLDCICKGPADMDEFDMIYPSLEEQTADEHSILSFVRALIRVRNTYPAIARGRVTKASGICEGKVAAFVKSVKDSNAKTVDELGGIFDTTGKTDREELRTKTLEALDGAADVLVVMNYNGEEKEIDLTKSAEAEGFRTLGSVLLASGGEVKLDGDTLTLPAYSVAILQK